MSYDKTQEEATNRLLLDMVKNQREYISRLFKTFIITLVCYTLILVSMIIGFFYLWGTNRSGQVWKYCNHKMLLMNTTNNKTMKRCFSWLKIKFIKYLKS